VPSRSPLARPAGPLPARVYWLRRAVVLVVPLALVLLLGSFLSRSSDGSDGGDAGASALAGFDDASDDGTTAAASATASAAPPTGTDAETPTRTTRAKKKKKTKEALAAPDGPCAASDVLVEPALVDAVAGRDVRIRLLLRTTGREACSWQVSPATLTVKITSGSDDIWFSRECPSALPEKDVVVRRAKDTKVGFDWNGKRSDDECSNQVQWALPGWYHVEAAALAGEPREQQFQLASPAPTTQTASPKNEKKKDGGRGADAKPRSGESAPTAEPTGPASGATEPSG
jgi:hypothetical protein